MLVLFGDRDDGDDTDDTTTACGTLTTAASADAFACHPNASAISR
jgi:hypothetical protein